MWVNHKNIHVYTGNVEMKFSPCFLPPICIFLAFFPPPVPSSLSTDLLIPRFRGIFVSFCCSRLCSSLSVSLLSLIISLALSLSPALPPSNISFPPLPPTPPLTALSPFWSLSRSQTPSCSTPSHLITPSKLFSLLTPFHSYIHARTVSFYNKPFTRYNAAHGTILPARNRR
jgi:hypothetical protein